MTDKLARINASLVGEPEPVDGDYEEPAAASKAKPLPEDAEVFRDFRACRRKAIDHLRAAAEMFSAEYNAAFNYPHKFEISRGSFCENATVLRQMTEALIEIARKP